MVAEVRMKPKMQAIARRLYWIINLLTIACLLLNLCFASPAIAENSILLKSSHNSRTELNRLLQEKNKHPANLEIDKQIRDTFGRAQAVLVLDMAGFSRLTVREGIITALATIENQNAIAIPVIKANGGSIIKLEADNIFAVFPDVQQAAIASVAILNRLNSVNLNASIGIGYGELLIIADGDGYGNELNLAFKLGEDVAHTGEILLTEAAYKRLDG